MGQRIPYTKKIVVEATNAPRKKYAGQGLDSQQHCMSDYPKVWIALRIKSLAQTTSTTHRTVKIVAKNHPLG
jgi:hypothetical protein